MTPHRLVFFYLLLLVIASAPIFLAVQPPLQDYPAHMARMFILMNPHDPILQTYYQIVWQPIPNLAMDLIVPALAHITSLDIAGRLFIVLTFALMTAGCLHLNFSLNKKISPLALFSFLFLYNACFLQGFLNFLFGCGLLLHALSFWIRLRPYPRYQLVFGCCAALLLFFTHLYAVALFGFFIFLFENIRPCENLWKRHLRIGLPFVVPALLFFLASPTGNAQISSLEFTPISVKIAALGSLMFFSYNNLVNLLLLLCLINIIPALCTPETRRMLWPLMVGAVLIYLPLPKQVMSSDNADWRLMVPFVFIILSCASDRLGSRSLRAFLGFLIVFLCLEMAALYKPWTVAAQDYNDFKIIAKQIPEGSRVFPVVAGPQGSPHIESSSGFSSVRPEHLFSWAVIDQKIFTPDQFAAPSQQPLQFRPPYDEIADKISNHNFPVRHLKSQAADWDSAMRYYDYALVMAQEDDNQAPFPFRVLARQGLFTLYQNTRAPGPLPPR